MEESFFKWLYGISLLVVTCAFIIMALLFDTERTYRIKLERNLHDLDSIYKINYSNFKQDSVTISNYPVNIDNYYELKD